jgi:hypothetical protein
MKQNHKSNKNRSKLFGVVINPVLSEKVDWKKYVDSRDRRKTKAHRFS